MLSTMLKGIALVALVALIAYLGVSAYSCFIAQPAGQMDVPDQTEAAYSVYIKNTGGLIMTDEYEVNGTEVGGRIFILHGFWEVRGQTFTYKNRDVILDETVFGEITVRRRK